MEKSIGSAAHNRLIELLILARKEAKVTQTELANRLQRGQSFVAYYESGQRRLDVIEFLEIAKALNLDVNEAIFETSKLIS